MMHWDTEKVCLGLVPSGGLIRVHVAFLPSLRPWMDDLPLPLASLPRTVLDPVPSSPSEPIDSWGGGLKCRVSDQRPGE